jgi:RNA polymerase sigma-70 factor (ECF subfamily)
VTPAEHLAETVRVEGRRVLATLIRAVGDMQLAEDAVQDAALAAMRTWPVTGVPDDPRAWLTVTARNKAYDVLRREAARPAKETAAGWYPPSPVPDVADDALASVEPASVVDDDLLRLVFTCCHPALSMQSRVALALRTLVALEVGAIARAFLVPEATMAKRLVRARQKIAAAKIPYRVPSDAELPDRLPAVLATVHLIATEAHAPTGGSDVARTDLEAEAIRLARLLTALMPGEPEVLSLLALLLFTAARRPARAAADGASVLLADQDRALWDAAAIEEAKGLLAEATRRSCGVAGPYQLQAHLSACHSTAPSWDDTDWDRIVALYDLLLQISANPAVSLNRAVAIGERDGPQAMLAALDAIDGMSGRSHLWHAARADSLARLGRRDDAADELRLALELAQSGPDLQLLTSRLAALLQLAGRLILGRVSDLDNVRALPEQATRLSASVTVPRRESRLWDGAPRSGLGWR